MTVDDYEVRKFEMRVIVTQHEWDDNQSQVVAMLKFRAAKQIAEWILEEGMIEFETQYDISSKRMNVYQSMKALKRKK